MILSAREFPVLSMLEDVFGQLMTRYYNKSKEALQDWTGQLCPKIKDKLNKIVDWSADYVAKPCGKGVFQVCRDETTYIVELNLRSCSCRRWQLTRIPCTHACACLRHERVKPEQMVSKCYSIHTYMQAYGTTIRPLRDKSEWTKTNGPTVQPPLYEKKIGRPKKSRRKNPEEKEGGTRLSRAGVVIHCGYCREAGHNRTGCPRLQAIAEAEAAADNSQAANNSQHADNSQAEENDSIPRPRRKRRRTVQEQISIPNSTRGPTHVDEFGDADIPEMFQVILSLIFNIFVFFYTT